MGISIAAAALAATFAPACATPAPPAVTIVSPTTATFASTADPAGRPVVARFRVGGASTYGVMLGRGHGAIRWQSTVSTLRPGRRYTVVAVVTGSGCRRAVATSFVTPRHDDTVLVAAAPVVTVDEVAPSALDDGSF